MPVHAAIAAPLEFFSSHCCVQKAGSCCQLQAVRGLCNVWLSKLRLKSKDALKPRSFAGTTVVASFFASNYCFLAFFLLGSAGKGSAKISGMDSN